MTYWDEVQKINNTYIKYINDTLWKELVNFPIPSGETVRIDEYANFTKEHENIISERIEQND